jgi:hypothetical protein
MHTVINAAGGWDNWNAVALEQYSDCTCKAEANDRAKKWYESVKKTTKPTVLLPYQAVICNDDSDATTSGEKSCCAYCTKTFARKDNCKRHMNMCKFKGAYEKFHEETEKIKQTYDEIIQKMKTSMNATCKMHPKTLTKINNHMQQNNMNSNNRTINNMNINNYNIVELGKENISDVFTREEKTQVLNKRFKCLDYLIETVHFSDKYKQFQNIAITNIHDSLAYKYVESANKFVTVDKDELLEEILSCRMEDICEFFDNHDELDLDRLTINAVKNFIHKIENDKDRVKEMKMRDIRLIVYNRKDMMKSKLITNA